MFSYTELRQAIIRHRGRQRAAPLTTLFQRNFQFVSGAASGCVICQHVSELVGEQISSVARGAVVKIIVGVISVHSEIGRPQDRSGRWRSRSIAIHTHSHVSVLQFLT